MATARVYSFVETRVRRWRGRRSLKIISYHAIDMYGTCYNVRQGDVLCGRILILMVCS